MKQRTIAKPVETIGIGLHKGEPIKMRLEPLDDDSGIIFYRSDKAVTIELKPENVVNENDDDEKLIGKLTDVVNLAEELDIRIVNEKIKLVVQKWLICPKKLVDMI